MKIVLISGLRRNISRNMRLPRPGTSLDSIAQLCSTFRFCCSVIVVFFVLIFSSAGPASLVLSFTTGMSLHTCVPWSLFLTLPLMRVFKWETSSNVKILWYRSFNGSHSWSHCRNVLEVYGKSPSSVSTCLDDGMSSEADEMSIMARCPWKQKCPWSLRREYRSKAVGDDSRQMIERFDCGLRRTVHSPSLAYSNAIWTFYARTWHLDLNKIRLMRSTCFLMLCLHYPVSLPPVRDVQFVHCVDTSNHEPEIYP